MKRLNSPTLAFLLWAALSCPAPAREQYQMTHPPGPPPSAPIGSAMTQNSLMVPAIGADFWKTGGAGMLSNSLPEGTVLTGILQEDISSNKSNPGDVFSILLPYGAQGNGRQVVPPGSKIVGVIKSAVPAKSLRFGQPGNIEISLQSLILPDGRSVRFHGFIDQNANLNPSKPPKVKPAGQQLSDYGNYAKAFFLQFPAGIGRSMNAQHRGADYSLPHGTSVPVRVTANIGLPPPVAPPAGYPPPALSSYQQYGYGQSLAASNNVPGQTYGQPGQVRITPGAAAPEPGYLPAGPQLRNELPSTESQGIRATPLTLDRN